MRIDIFIDTDTKGLYRRDRGATWYRMESTFKNKPITKKDRITWIDHNRNGAALEGILFALGQIRAKESDLYIHVSNPYICGYSKHLPEWEKRGYKTLKGNPIKYKDMWKKISDIAALRKNRLHFSRDVPLKEKADCGNV